ncbi:xylose isomerase [Kosmotoga arenicorallina S304]|uniref:Xylose isomerase n=1 Tax=Kosmotoga arenicorallina S304 TaxID=1453497 RepID=A0A176K3T1_9BACT|nr:xylose isomerase [Kosmotoga arenicorallina]OAA31691.1 xylose isomerase [Kosmotoga arenicorallina S304]
MEFFPEVNRIEFEGKRSTNPLAFKFYNPDEAFEDTTMKDYLRFSVAFWHTFNGTGQDMFGAPSFFRPWDNAKNDLDKALMKIDALVEFCEKLGIEYFCFHDRDIAPEGKTLRETNAILDRLVNYLKERMKESGLKLLWGTANLFSHPRYAHGAATSCSADVFAYAAAQVKKALEITKELGGEGYVFWGGREGYSTLLNTDMELELDNLARFLRMAVDYAKEIGFKGQFLIEPKPMEPTKHQYDYDVAASMAFLRKYGLEGHFKFNIEVNHATLAGHTFNHELRYARINDMLGSIDANQGDLFLGWDTDQFPTDLYVTTLGMYEIIKKGGIKPGGLNFDAKIRRESLDITDLFTAHIAGMDAFALGLKAAKELISSEFENVVAERYLSFKTGIGKEIIEGNTDLRSLERHVLDMENIALPSGRQEYLETLINRAILLAVND